MHEIILHHYDEAPSAEKLRLVFGSTALAWRSVIQPAAPPTGTRVAVSPSNHAEVEIERTLAQTSAQSVSIRRHDHQVGDVVVHFPQIGYDIVPR